MTAAPVIVVKGGDDVLRGERTTALVRELVGDGDATLLVTEFHGDDYEIREVVDAAQTAPFLTDRRIVVARDAERFKAKEDLAGLLGYLAEPLDTTVLVVEWGGSGRVPKALADAVKAAKGDTVDTSPGRKLGDFVGQAFASAGLRPDRETSARVVDWLGDDAGKLPGLLAVLASAYGEGVRLSVDDVEPFLGEAGGVPPWDLTDAIDKGDIAGALTALSRMLGAGRHPMQLMATLHTHFQRILRLEGTTVRGEAEAAAILGLKGSTFPARKALTQARALGHDRVAESMRLLATTDLELRGTVDWPDALAMEVLVARLARLAKTAR